MRLIVSAILLLLSLVLFGYAFWQVSNASADLQRMEMRVPAVRPDLAPIAVLLYRPTTQPKGIAIVAHGYSANKELMQNFTICFAKLGLAAYSFDFPGHGEAQDKLDGADGRQLEDSLQAVYNFAQQQANRDGYAAGTVLLGHSMGSRAVTVFALDRADTLPNLSAVIPVSPALHDADLARLTAKQPPNLLIEVGEADLPTSIKGTATGIANATKGLSRNAADPDAYGNWADDNARKAVTFAGANHLTILLSNAAPHEAERWAARSLNLPLPPPADDSRNVWVAVMLGAAVLAAFPFAGLFAPFEARRPFVPRFLPSATLMYFIMTVVGVGAAILTLSWFNPLTWLGIALTPYLAMFFFIVGGLAWLVMRPLVPTSLPRLEAEGLLGGLIIGIVTWLFWYFVLGSSTTYALFRLSFSEGNFDRLWKMAIVALFLFPFFSLDEGIWRGWQENKRPFVSIIGGILSKALVLGGLVLAIMFDNGLGFLSLALPVLAILFVVAQLFGFAIYAATRNLWASGWWNALFFAWVLTMLFAAALPPPLPSPEMGEGTMLTSPPKWGRGFLAQTLS